eukprot:COSAG02_NODE_7426_length_3020_cov_2.224846_1_plen_68_part_00
MNSSFFIPNVFRSCITTWARATRHALSVRVHLTSNLALSAGGSTIHRKLWQVEVACLADTFELGTLR